MSPACIQQLVWTHLPLHATVYEPEQAGLMHSQRAISAAVTLGLQPRRRHDHPPYAQDKEKAPPKPKEEPKKEDGAGFTAFGGKPNKLR